MAQPWELDAPVGSPAAATAAPWEADAPWSGDAPAAPQRRTPMQSLGLGARGVLQGAGSLGDMALDVVRIPAQIGRAATERVVDAAEDIGRVAAERVVGAPIPPRERPPRTPFTVGPGPLRSLGVGVSDALGLPTPATPTERITNLAVEGGSGGLAGAGALRMVPQLPGAAGAVLEALRDAPRIDTAAGMAGGAAQGAVEEAQGGPVEGLAANAGASTLTALMASILGRRPAAPAPVLNPPEPPMLALPAPEPRAPVQPATVPDAIGRLNQERVRILETGRPVDEAGNPDANWQPAPGSPEAQRIADLDARIEGLQAREAAQAPGVEAPPRFVAPEERLPRTPEQVQQGREAEQAFAQADAQRGRAGPEVRDTQPAGRPEGVAPQSVLLDQGYPVRVVGDDGSGFVSVERYDPRTGAPAEDAVPYVVRRSTLEGRQYTAQPRQAQDFTARAAGPASPEMPRDAGPGAPVREPEQTYRATPPDPNQDFPGATRPGPAPEQPPPGRSPLPDQPPPAEGRRWSSAEEAERAFQARRAQAEADAAAARARGEWQSGQQSTNQPGAQTPDGRRPISPGGYVASSAGGPIRFGDQKQAARWILSQGQAKSPDQFFEIAVHPSGQGFTVREVGRNPGGGGGAPPGGRAAPEAGAQPGRTNGEAPRLGGPDGSSAPRSAEQPEPAAQPPGRGGASAAADRGAPATNAPVEAAARVEAPRVGSQPDGMPAGGGMAPTPEQPAVGAGRRDSGDAGPPGSGRSAPISPAPRRASGAAEDATSRGTRRAGADTLFDETQPRGARNRVDPGEGPGVIPAPQRWLGPNAKEGPPWARNLPETKGGMYLVRGEQGFQDITGATTRAATIEVDPSGKPQFRVLNKAAPRSTAYGPLVKANLYKSKAGWRWLDAPEGSPATIVSVESRGNHYYALRADFDTPTTMMRYADAPSEPRLRPTANGVLERGNVVGRMVARGVEHPVYDVISVKTKPDTGLGRPEDYGISLYSTPFDPAAIKRLLVDPAMRQAVKFRDWLRSTTAARAFSTLFDSNRGALFVFRDMYPNVPEVGVLTDALATDPGTGRVVKQTFETEWRTRTRGLTNRTMAILGKDISDADARAVRDVLAGGRASSPEIADKAKRIRKILEAHHAYLKSAGVEVGKQANFFPRQYDEMAIRSDPNGFRQAVEGQYIKAGLSAADAQDAARAFTDEVLGQATVGFRNEALLSANSLKGRSLPASADAALAKWLVTDPRVALSRYFDRTTRVAEFTKRFGKNGELAAEWFARMARQGVNPDHIDQMRAHFRSATGTLDNGAGVSVASTAAGWIQTFGIVARLTGAVISSLPEALAVGARFGSPVKGLQALADQLLPRRVWETASISHARQVAEWIGVVGTTGPDMTVAAQAGVSGQTALQTRITDGLFKMNGLHAVTDKQMVVATKYATLFVRQMADEVASGAKTKASATRLLAELGIEAKDAAALSAWLKKNPGEPELLAETTVAQQYRTAVTRFVKEAIQSPEAVDRPLWSAHPIGRLAYGITSFQYAFTRNVLFRGVKTADAITASGLTLQDRARLAGPLAATAILMAAQYGISEARDRIGNSRQRAERDPAITVVSNLDRMGVFGNLSPLVNIALSARYEADPATRAVGPYVSNITSTLKDLVGTIPKPYGPNSANTNNAEHRFAQTLYSNVLAPTVIAGMSAASSALPAPARAAAGAAAIAGTRPDVARGFADMVAGPKQVTPRQAREDRGRGISSSSGIRGGGGISATR